jgi:hypothetical protein
MGFFLTEPTLLIVLFQTAVFVLSVPLTYLAYRWVRAPLKRDYILQQLAHLGIPQTKKLNKIISDEFHFKHYVWPIFLASFVLGVTFIVIHPFFIQQGSATGMVEEIINIFNADDLFPRAILAGRFLMWGWFGAFI